MYNAQVSQHPLLVKKFPDGTYRSYQDAYTVFDLGQYQSKIGCDSQPEIVKTCVGVPKQFAIESGKKDYAFGNVAIAQKSIVDLEWPINDCEKSSAFVQYVLDNIKSPQSSVVFVCPSKESELRQNITELIFSMYETVQNIAFMD